MLKKIWWKSHNLIMVENQHFYVTLSPFNEKCFFNFKYKQSLYKYEQFSLLNFGKKLRMRHKIIKDNHRILPLSEGWGNVKWVILLWAAIRVCKCFKCPEVRKEGNTNKLFWETSIIRISPHDTSHWGSWENTFLYGKEF